MKDIHQPWSEWDQELNRAGEWLLVGSLACSSLPAIPGLIGLATIFVYAVFKSDPFGRRIFKHRDDLKRGFEQQKLSPSEQEEYYKIAGSLNVNQKKRNATLFKIGCTLWTLCLLYQLWKWCYTNGIKELFF